MKIRDAGRYLGFFTSMLVFASVLFLITTRLHIHALPYFTFVPAAMVFFLAAIKIKRSFK